MPRRLAIFFRSLAAIFLIRFFFFFSSEVGGDIELHEQRIKSAPTQNSRRWPTDLKFATIQCFNICVYVYYTCIHKYTNIKAQIHIQHKYKCTNWPEICNNSMLRIKVFRVCSIWPKSAAMHLFANISSFLVFNFDNFATFAQVSTESGCTKLFNKSLKKLDTGLPAYYYY